MNELRTVRPISTPAAYIGGKRQLAKRVIVPMIEAVAHSAYAEPFVGMGGVFFRRQRVPRAEIVNDVSMDVITLFRILQEHYELFLQMLRFKLTSRSEFERLLQVDGDTLTDLQRAARFLYLQRASFGGKVSGRSFGVSPLDGGRFNVEKLIPALEAIHERLAGVVIERLPYHAFIPRYDRVGMLFFCDPPYWNCENDYGPGVFSRDDFLRLSQILRGLKGAFILTLNDVPEVREIFGGFHIDSVELTYTVARGKAAQAREIIITNRPQGALRQAA